ncbi:15-hydroxyprostaglandin dehydrogenase [NAD(+)] [Dendroctonus ponderosae]|uniref:15-hydroxyprostaglandin dehydrogenase [NAD(+)] n=1 Tax=Dendroctonus ponderosae TaxID=77166 RepID=UPI002035D975|nr:15-hydroxyprostaglandin dehydrogenase [NAD(+)] [Dendroctonus ponderosae]
MVLMRRAARATSSLMRSRNLFIKKHCSAASENDTVEEMEEDFNLAEKSAIINGGASGIGFEIAREFLKRGVPHLSIIDIDEERGEKAAAALTKEFGREKVLFFEADVADAVGLDDVYRKSMQFHDIPEIIVNSAGIMNDTLWDKQIYTNMTGSVVGTLLGLQYMSKSSKGYGGIIVNIGSILGIIPSSGYPLHTMTQFGICGFSKAIGCEKMCILGNHIHRTGVKVFALCPGLTDTKLLLEAPAKAINDRFAQEHADEIEGSTAQKTTSVAKGLADILDKAKAGSVWVVENDGGPYEVTYPGNVLEIKREDDKEDVTSSIRN